MTAAAPVPGAPGFAAYPAKPVDVQQIERELTAMWSAPLGGAAPTDAPVTRACMSNLIVYVPDQAAAARLGDEVVPIVEHHPSRVLMLVAEGASSGEPLEAYVSALCHLGDAGRQVCSEHVVISAAGGAIRRLPSVVRPLILGDLPTALWWTGGKPPPQGGDLFRELSVDASQVVFDSLEWPGGDAQAHGFVATATWAAGLPKTDGVSDLAWTRLGPWRSLVSQALDPAVAPGALAALSDVEIEHGAQTAPKAWLLIAWMADRLRWKLAGARRAGERHFEWTYTRRDGGSARVASRPAASGQEDAFGARLRSGAGAQAKEVTVVRSAGDRISIIGAATPTHAVVMPYRSRAALVAQELADLGRDAIYRASLDDARLLVEKAIA